MTSFKINQNLIQYADFSGAFSTTQIDTLCVYKIARYAPNIIKLLSFYINMLENAAIGLKMWFMGLLGRDGELVFQKLFHGINIFLSLGSFIWGFDELTPIPP